MSRLMTDFMYLLNEVHENIIVNEYDDSNFSRFKAVITGPVDSPYETGMFEVEVRVPDAFPFAPPKIKFLTKVWHPNISDRGRICLDILAEEWKPSMTLYKTLEGIQSLLREPNPESPLNFDYSDLHDLGLNHETAIIWTKYFAAGSRTVPHMEEKIGVLQALGAQSHKAVLALTTTGWELEQARRNLCLN